MGASGAAYVRDLFYTNWARSATTNCVTGRRGISLSSRIAFPQVHSFNNYNRNRALMPCSQDFRTSNCDSRIQWVSLCRVAVRMAAKGRSQTGKFRNYSLRSAIIGEDCAGEVERAADQDPGGRGLARDYSRECHRD
jgi:hypothetical protein